MNTTNILSSAVLGVGLLFALPQARADGERAEAASAEAAPVLELRVQLPPSWHASSMLGFPDDDFAHMVATEFKRLGFAGRVSHTWSYSQSPESGYALDVRIIEWRRNRAGNVECIFSASMITPDGERNLGVFSDTVLSITMSRQDRWQVAEAYVEAAEGAIRELYRALERADVTGLWTAREA